MSGEGEGAAVTIDGIGEAEFNQWKHHPATKMFLRYLGHFERQQAERMIGMIRQASAAPDPYTLGMFNGTINTIAEIASLEFQHIVAFYPSDEEQDT